MVDKLKKKQAKAIVKNLFLTTIKIMQIINIVFQN